MRKLAIVVPSLRLGGAERIAAMQAAWFARAGFKVALITLDGSAHDHYNPQHPNIDRIRIQGNSPKRLFGYIQNQDFDLTIDHAHWHAKHFEFFELMGASKHSLVIFDHSTYFYPLYFKTKWDIFKNRAVAYRNADAVSLLTRHTCQLFRQNHPATVFIPNPLSYESDAISPVLESKNIIAVANWQRPEKRLDRVLEIFAAVASMVPESRLILVGPMSQDELRDLTKCYQLAPERIEAVGQQEDIEPYYLRARVFLHASEMEGFGLVLNEAGLHGLPRVAMNSPGLDEVIAHGVDGYLVGQGDRQAAVNYLVSLLSDDQLCQRMSVTVRRSVQRFSLEKIGARWEWLVNLLTGGSSSADVEKVLAEDCSEQGVDDISIERIAHDYDAQLSRMIQLSRESGVSTVFSSGNSLQSGGELARKTFKSKAAQVLSDASEWLESRYVARLIRESGLFDQRWYEEQYPDIGSSRIDPALHYVKFGAMEGRNPSAEFDTRYYLSNHRDIVFKKENPLLHFLEARELETLARRRRPRDVKKPGSFKKGSWSVKDQAWLERFSEDRSLLTILEPDYLGIRQSASQFVKQEQMLFIKDDLDDLTIDYYADLIAETSPDKILLQGFPRSYLKLVLKIRKIIPKTPVYCIYHGSFTQQHVPEERKCLQTLIELCREGVLNRIGLVKEGMAETLQTLGIDAGFVMNFIAKLPQVPRQAGQISVGIIGSEWQDRKPLYHQIAACKHFDYDEISIVGSENHAAGFCELLEVNARHLGVLPQSEMPAFLAGNTLNLYVTLSECAPMVPLESLAEGVPCLFGPTSHFFSDHEYLRSRLVVDIPDSETRIARFASMAIAERQKIITEYREYAVNYNRLARKSFEGFLQGGAL